MARESKEEEPVEAPPEIKPKLTLVVLLSALIGIFLTLLTVGAIYHFQSGKAVENELAVSKEEVRRKTLMLTEAQEQVTALSRDLIRKMKEVNHPFILGSECDVLSVPESIKTINDKVNAFVGCSCCR